MYRRYTNVNREKSSPNQIKQIRIRDVMILLILAGFVFLLIKALPAFRYQDEERKMYIRKMQSECNIAVDNVEKSLNSISYNGNSGEILAEIRSHISAVQTLNDMYNSQRKQYLIPAEKPDICIQAVDNYLNDISLGGQHVTNMQIELSSAITDLKNELSSID